MLTKEQAEKVVDLIDDLIFERRNGTGYPTARIEELKKSIVEILITEEDHA